MAAGRRRPPLTQRNSGHNQGQAVKTQHILIIDDDAGQHLLLESQLKLGGFTVHHAYGGQEALTLAGHQQVDLIILDINMPGMDGFQTLEKLRKQPALADIPVIFLSSLDRQYLKVKGLEGGADDYLTKPFDTAELTARVKAVLRRAAKKPTPAPAGTMQGHIQSMGLPELLQSMSLAAKTCTITFPEMNGEIIIDRGAIVGMRQGAFSGKDALLRLLLLQRGSFLVTYDQVDAQAVGEPISIEYLLLFGVSQIDEIREMLEEIGDETTPVRLTGQPPAPAALAALAPHLPLPLLTLLILLAGELKDNVETIRSALAQGSLQFSPPGH
jgi:DNA-binding response OmpR family regulator